MHVDVSLLSGVYNQLWIKYMLEFLLCLITARWSGWLSSSVETSTAWFSKIDTKWQLLLSNRVKYLYNLEARDLHKPPANLCSTSGLHPTCHLQEKQQLDQGTTRKPSIEFYEVPGEARTWIRNLLSIQ